ncbi:MAG: oxidoreductase family [Bacteroidetes bacterium]|nr:oxidoreductase family [Bacteroidota bacterium]
MAILEELKWRYATKKMNGQIVPQDKIDYILESARLAPSSSGLQPYRIFVISNRNKLQEIKENVFKDFPFNQGQINDCSHLLVWASWDNYTPERIRKTLLNTSRQRGLPDLSSEDYQKRLWSFFEPKGDEWHKNHCAKQAYISFGMAMVAAAEQKVDATPMEGFNFNKMDKILGLKKLGLKSIVSLPLGYRDEEGDWLIKLQKVRTPKDEFITVIA